MVDKGEEAEFITVPLRFDDKHIRLLLVYGPQENDSVSKIRDFYDSISVQVERVNLAGDSVFLVGDFNATLGTEITRGRVMPYMCHTETCRRSGYTFWPSNPRQGVFFRSWLQIRVPNLYDHSEPGCLFTVLFGTLPLVLTYLSFVQEINPSFDVFNIFKVLI